MTDRATPMSMCQDMRKVKSLVFSHNLFAETLLGGLILVLIFLRTDCLAAAKVKLLNYFMSLRTFQGQLKWQYFADDATGFFRKLPAALISSSECGM